jgi:isopentenyl-diphosphate Delta-isomerase
MHRTASKKFPPVVVVDDNDNEIGSAMLAEVWQKGLYHRVVCIFITDDRGRMLLQLRGPHVGVYPNCWDQAAGGHVDEGFSYDQAATMEVAEEVGLHDVVLTVLGTHRFNTRDRDHVINQFERVYLAQLAHDTVLKSDPEEVNKLQWFTSSELKERKAQHAESFTPGLLHALDKYFPDI